jgi:hypothetical protein
MNFVYLRSYMLNFFAFCLDSCIVNKGEKFVHDLGTWERLEGVPIGSGNFEQFGVVPVTWCGLNAPQVVRCMVGSLTALSKVSRFLLLVAFTCCFAALVQGKCALAQGELAYVQGELFVVFELWIGGLCSLLEHCFVSDVSSRCPCLRGPRLVFFK